MFLHLYLLTVTQGCEANTEYFYHTSCTNSLPNIRLFIYQEYITRCSINDIRVHRFIYIEYVPTG
jgi:hypothetical protein